MEKAGVEDEGDGYDGRGEGEGEGGGDEGAAAEGKNLRMCRRFFLPVRPYSIALTATSAGR